MLLYPSRFLRCRNDKRKRKHWIVSLFSGGAGSNLVGKEVIGNRYLNRIKTFSLEYIHREIENAEYIESCKSKGNAYRTRSDNSICRNIILQIQRGKIREHSKECTRKYLSRKTLMLERIIENCISTMPDNIRSNRHEHSNHG